MSRALQLAAKGAGRVSPNPMVGAVIVHQGKIIGEGFHCQYGEAHAEVNAIASVKDKVLLRQSTLYVTLEPCSHWGKTPPCCELIARKGIPRVVVACVDPFAKVQGRGIEMMRREGVEVTTGVLQQEAEALNKAFFLFHTEHRPYVILKWAQSADGYMDIDRTPDAPHIPTPISNNFTRMAVHKLRSEVDAIMVGTNTAVVDNPSLTVRYWAGKNPVRIVLDRKGRVPANYHLFNGEVETILFSEKEGDRNCQYEVIDRAVPLIPQLLERLHGRKIQSLLVEGGAQLLNGFIDSGLWDEMMIETSSVLFGAGVKAPPPDGIQKDCRMVADSTVVTYAKKPS